MKKIQVIPNSSTEEAGNEEFGSGEANYSTPGGAI